MLEPLTKAEFYERTKSNGLCIEWTTPRDRYGYGRFFRAGTRWLAHRYALALEGIDVSDLVVHHVCSNKACVNPQHLAVMTQSEHAKHTHEIGQNQGNKFKRALDAGRCKNGHDTTLPGALRHKGNRRSCRVCELQTDIARAQRQILLIESGFWR